MVDLEQLKLAAFVQGARDMGRARGVPPSVVDNWVESVVGADIRANPRAMYDNQSGRVGPRRIGYGNDLNWGRQILLPGNQSEIPGQNW